MVFDVVCQLSIRVRPHQEHRELSSQRSRNFPQMGLDWIFTMSPHESELPSMNLLIVCSKSEKSLHFFSTFLSKRLVQYLRDNGSPKVMTDCEAKCRVLVLGQVTIKSANGERAVIIASTDPSLDNAGRARVWLAAPWVLNTWCAWLFGEFWLNSDCRERPYKIYIMLHHVTATHPYALKLSRSWKGLPLSPARPCPSTGSEKCGMDCGGDAHPSNLKEYSQKDMSSKPGWNRFSCKGWAVWELLDQGHTSFEADLWWVWADTDLRKLARGNTCRSQTMSLCDARFE